MDFYDLMRHKWQSECRLFRFHEGTWKYRWTR